MYAELDSRRLAVCTSGCGVERPCSGGSRQPCSSETAAAPAAGGSVALRVLSAWAHDCPPLLQLVPQQHSTRYPMLEQSQL